MNNNPHSTNLLLNLGIEKEIADAWLNVRKPKRAVNSEIAFNSIAAEIKKCKLIPNECAKLAVAKSWSGFEADWVKDTDIKKPLPWRICVLYPARRIKKYRARVRSLYDLCG